MTRPVAVHCALNAGRPLSPACEPRHTSSYAVCLQKSGSPLSERVPLHTRAQRTVSACRGDTSDTADVAVFTRDVRDPGSPPNAESIARLTSSENGSNSSSPSRSVFFVGIGGVGMAPLAALAVRDGWRVSGSDAKRNDRTDELACRGCRVLIGHRASNLCDGEQVSGYPDVVVASSAVPPSNPELRAAREAGVEVLSRRQWLQEVTSAYRVIAVAGTHGKSTTSAMAALALSHLTNGAVTAVVGGSVPQFPDGTGFLEPVSSSESMGEQWLVCEADEYDRTFLGLSPHIAVVTNVEHDHVDCFKDVDDVQEAFLKFVVRLRPGGLLLLCAEDTGAMRLKEAAQHVLAEKGCTLQTYGFSDSCHWRVVPRGTVGSAAQHFHLLYLGQPVGNVSLPLPGTHNILNSAVALAAAVHADTLSQSPLGGHSTERDGFRRSCEQAAVTLSSFAGVQRRFEIIGAWVSASGRRVEVVDDYAHHPTEIRATLSAAMHLYLSRFPESRIRIMAVFQPHTSSRLTAFIGEFCDALKPADEVIVLDTYAARLKGEVSTSSATPVEEVVRRMRIMCPNKLCRHFPGSMRECAGSVARAAVAQGETEAGEFVKEASTVVVVVLMGAGDITNMGPELMSSLQAYS